MEEPEEWGKPEEPGEPFPGGTGGGSCEPGTAEAGGAARWVLRDVDARSWRSHGPWTGASGWRGRWTGPVLSEGNGGAGAVESGPGADPA